MLRLVIFLLFLGSGMAGLIYQVVWTKLLSLVFGVTMLAVSTVLTSFFGGLALGSWLGGRWVEKKGNGFFWYGAAEIIIGLYALVFLGLLHLNNSVYVMLAQSLSASFYGLSLLKFVLAALLLFIPTTLMGATLPILSKALANSSSRFAKDVGGLYAINTIGAILGALLTGFYFIPSFGMKTILFATGFLNIAIGITAIAAGRTVKEDGVAPAETPSSYGSDIEPIPPRFSKLLVASFAISGFTGLAYEVIWTRILGFILTGTVYAFATVLVAFLTGIAAGSLVFSRFTDRIRSQGFLIVLLAAVEALIGLSSIALIVLYDKLPSMALWNELRSVADWGRFVYLNFFTSYVALIIPSFLFGATFPLVCKIYGGRAESVGKKIGNIYSVNTVGGIVGSFISGFVLVPFVGMQNTIVLVGVINIAVALALLFFNPFSARTINYAFTGATVVLAAVLVALLPKNMPLTIHENFLAAGESVIFYKEGAAATVMISERHKPGESDRFNRRIMVNGNRATSAYYEGLQINRFQGVLPMILHPNPQEVLVICFGSGTTFGTLSQFPVQRVDNVEIAPTVVEGAQLFTRENMDVLHNPRSHFNFDDGRSFLEATPRKFDVITEEPMHPSLAGVVNLYTREYYELAKAHLKEDGIMSQWIPLYNLSIEDVRIMVKTFQSVFPHTTIWIANSDIFMIGSPKKLQIDYGRLLDKINQPNIHALLKDIDLEDPYEFLNTFMMNEEQVAAYAGGMEVMSDNMPIVEFTGPKSLNTNTVSPNIAELFRYREPVLAYLSVPSPYNGGEVSGALTAKYEAGKYNLIGRAYLADNNLRMAAQYFRAALQADPTDRNSLHYNKKLVLY